LSGPVGNPLIGLPRQPRLRALPKSPIADASADTACAVGEGTSGAPCRGAVAVVGFMYSLSIGQGS
jgi:hypothetical protein